MRGSGVADVVAQPGRQVYGVVYEVGDEDIALLDRLEGFSPGVDAYVRLEREVIATEPPNATMRVELYEVARKVPFVVPSRDYLDLLIDGAIHWRLPATYIDWLGTFPADD